MSTAASTVTDPATDSTNAATSDPQAGQAGTSTGQHDPVQHDGANAADAAGEPGGAKSSTESSGGKEPEGSGKPKREFTLDPTDAERAAYERIRGKGATIVKPPGAEDQPGENPAPSKTATPGNAKPSGSEPSKGKPSGNGEMTPEQKKLAEGVLVGWGVEDKGQRKDWSRQTVDPHALDLAKSYLRRAGLPFSAIEKMSPQETMKAGAHQFRMQQGLDRILRGGNTPRATPAAPASKADAPAGEERGAASSEAGESDTDEAAEPAIQVTDADLSPAQQELLDSVVDPEKYDRLKAELLEGVKARKLAEQLRNRSATQRTAAKESQQAITAAQQQLLYSRLNSTRDELLTRFPGLSDGAKFQAVLERMDRFADGLSLEDPPSDEQLASWMTEACGAVFVGELEAAARSRQRAATDLDGQMSQAGPRSAPVGNGGMSVEDAAFHARKQAGSNESEYRRLFNQFVSPAARRRT